MAGTWGRQSQGGHSRACGHSEPAKPAEVGASGTSPGSRPYPALLEASSNGLLDTHGSRFELRSAGLRIESVYCQLVRRNLVMEMDGHERETRTQRRIEPDRSDHRAPSRADPDLVAFTQAVSYAVLRREIESLATAEWRPV